MHNAMGSLVHGSEETAQDHVEESAGTPQGLDEKKFDFKTDIKTSIERIIEKRQATASTPNSAASSQQNTETSQAAPSTSQQPTSSAQPTSAAPTSSERPADNVCQPGYKQQPSVEPADLERATDLECTANFPIAVCVQHLQTSNDLSWYVNYREGIFFPPIFFPYYCSGNFVYCNKYVKGR
uniref:Uncharacterized protein n=1 Tax=Bionectria ochroleuca TaxID=29856 RepID=A0A0B7K7W1_BIOOC